MANLPLTFPQPTEQPIISYDWIDIANGTGIRIFYGISSENQGGVSYHIIPNTIAYSSQIETARTTIGTTEIDFDTSTFNLPQTIKGKAYLSLGFGCLEGHVMRIDATLYHVDSGGSETAITATIQSQNFTGPTGSGSEMAFMVLPITTVKRFKKGELLRMTIGIVASDAGNNVVGHDPKNRDGSVVTAAKGAATIMALHVPFDIDL